MSIAKKKKQKKDLPKDYIHQKARPVKTSNIFVHGHNHASTATYPDRRLALPLTSSHSKPSLSAGSGYTFLSLGEKTIQGDEMKQTKGEWGPSWTQCPVNTLVTKANSFRRIVVKTMPLSSSIGSADESSEDYRSRMGYEAEFPPYNINA